MNTDTQTNATKRPSFIPGEPLSAFVNRYFFNWTDLEDLSIYICTDTLNDRFIRLCRIDRETKALLDSPSVVMEEGTFRKFWCEVRPVTIWQSVLEGQLSDSV